MDPNTFPTKGNLILAKNSLALSRQGYELMDKKRNILIREMMNLITLRTFRLRSMKPSVPLMQPCKWQTWKWVSPLWNRFPTLCPLKIPSASKHEALWVPRSLW